MQSGRLKCRGRRNAARNYTKKHGKVISQIIRIGKLHRIVRICPLFGPMILCSCRVGGPAWDLFVKNLYGT